MKMMFFLLLVLPTLSQGQTLGLKGNLYPIEETNNIRSGYENTPPLHFDESLQMSAMKCAMNMLDDGSWVRSYEHPCIPMADGEGENIFITDEAKPPNDELAKLLFKNAIDAWNHEKTYLQDLIERFPIEPYRDLEVREYGHFTQLVWKDTKFAGCGGGVKLINNLFKYIIICRYSPPGNNYAYVTAKANLPAISEIAPLLIPEVPCKDDLEQCPLLKGNCVTHFVQENCRLTCGLCTNIDEDKLPILEKVIPVPVSYNKVASRCVDKTSCVNVVGYCEVPEVMDNCPVTCGLCEKDFSLEM